MRADRRSKKKLAVAFQFQMSDPAAWKCDACRKSGLEKKRRCGFLPVEELGAERVVWARGSVSTTECPKSFVNAESMEALERFAVWKTLGGADLAGMPAKEVEALMLLEAQWRMENNNNGQH